MLYCSLFLCVDSNCLISCHFILKDSFGYFNSRVSIWSHFTIFISLLIFSIW